MVLHHLCFSKRATNSIKTQTNKCSPQLPFGHHDAAGYVKSSFRQYSNRNCYVARRYRSATMMLRQVHFSLVDLELHSKYVPGNGETVFDRDMAVAQRTQV